MNRRGWFGALAGVAVAATVLKKEKREDVCVANLGDGCFVSCYGDDFEEEMRHSIRAANQKWMTRQITWAKGEHYESNPD